MLFIKCPYCGIRSQNEFAYGGDATVKRPELNKEISDKEFYDYKMIGLDMGFKIIESGPLVRSSYHADEQAKTIVVKK